MSEQHAFPSYDVLYSLIEKARTDGGCLTPRFALSLLETIERYAVQNHELRAWGATCKALTYDADGGRGIRGACPGEWVERRRRLFLWSGRLGIDVPERS